MTNPKPVSTQSSGSIWGLRSVYIYNRTLNKDTAHSSAIYSWCGGPAQPHYGTPQCDGECVVPTVGHIYSCEIRTINFQNIWLESAPDPLGSKFIDNNNFIANYA